MDEAGRLKAIDDRLRAIASDAANQVDDAHLAEIDETTSIRCLLLACRAYWHPLPSLGWRGASSGFGREPHSAGR